MEKKLERLFHSIKSYNVGNKSNKNDNLYWIDLNKNYCSCKGFYYNYLTKICYHIIAVSTAYKQNRYQIEILDDNKLNNYINNKIDNLMKTIYKPVNFKYKII